MLAVIAGYFVVGAVIALGIGRYLDRHPDYPRPPNGYVWPLCVIAWPIVAVGIGYGLLGGLRR